MYSSSRQDFVLIFISIYSSRRASDRGRDTRRIVNSIFEEDSDKDLSEDECLVNQAVQEQNDLGATVQHMYVRCVKCQLSSAFQKNHSTSSGILDRNPGEISCPEATGLQPVKGQWVVSWPYFSKCCYINMSDMVWYMLLTNISEELLIFFTTISSFNVPLSQWIQSSCAIKCTYFKTVRVS